MSVTGEKKAYNHGDRCCILSADGVTWRYWKEPYNMVGGLICRRPHPSKEERTVTIGEWKHIHDDDGNVWVHPEGQTCKIGLRTGFRYEHADGICTVSREGAWITDKDDTCYESHDKPGLHIPGDRGEFGMPGLGGSMSGLDHLIEDDARYKASLEEVVWTSAPGKLIITDDALPHWRCYITDEGVTVEYGQEGHGADATTEDAKYILSCIPEFLIHFLHKNTQYARAQTGHDLGAKGIIPDINRKTSALITHFWDRDGEGEMPGDTPEGLIDDLIGHLLLMRAKLRDR